MRAWRRIETLLRARKRMRRIEESFEVETDTVTVLVREEIARRLPAI